MALAEIDCEVHVLTSYVNSKELEMLKTRGVATHIVKPFYASKYVAPIFYTFIAKRLKQKYGINIVLGNGYTLHDDITWIHFPRLAWIRRARELHLEVPYRFRAETWFESHVFKSSKLLLAPSKLVVNDLTNLYGVKQEKIVQVYHGVDTDYYTPVPQDQREEYKRKIGKDRLGIEDKFVLLFVGEPRRKGLHILLDELRRINNLEDVILLIAGLRPCQELFSCINKLDLPCNVKVLGFLGTEDLKLRYQITDVFILPSLYDPFSIATLEAMACGAIPIVSRYAGVSELISNGFNGFIIDPLTKGSLSEVIQRILNMSQSKLRTMRSNAIHTAKKYSWTNVAKCLVNSLGNKLF